MTNKTPREMGMKWIEDQGDYHAAEEVIRALCDENAEQEVTIGYLLLTKKNLRDERDQLKAKLEAVRVLLRDDKPDAAYEILWNDYKEKRGE